MDAKTMIGIGLVLFIVGLVFLYIRNRRKK